MTVKTNGHAIESIKPTSVTPEDHEGVFHRSSKKVLELFSPLARDVFYHGPGSWQALRTIYKNKPGILELPLYPVTLGLAGAKDTRARLKEYTGLIGDVFDGGELSGNGEPCMYLDLACGCSEGPIKAAENHIEKTGNQTPNILIKCSDVADSAIRYSEEEANKRGVDHLMHFGTYRISRVDEAEPHEGYDGGGTHGILDYYNKPRGTKIFRKVHKVLKPGALFITTNMKKREGFNLTRKMMEKYGLWRICYKTKDDLGNMLYDAGFDDINVWETPRGYHLMATAKKPG